MRKIKNRASYGRGLSVGIVMLVSAPALAQQTGMPQMPMTGIPGAGPIQPLHGTYAYPIRAGLHRDMVQNTAIGAARGVDGDFLAQSSLQAVYTQAGEAPNCPGAGRSDMRGRSRIVGVHVETGTGAFLGSDQLSRLIVNQDETRAVVYLHGEVREWIPGPNFCDDGNYVFAGGSRGFLRLEYETVSHVVPLNFMAYPNPNTVDLEAFEEACRRFQDVALDAYREMNPRWSTIQHNFTGPIDWSVITPIPEGQGNGEQGSFLDGTVNSQDVIDAASDAADAISLGQEIAEFFTDMPTLAQGAAGAAQWVIMEAVNYFMGDIMVDPVDAMMMMAQMGHGAFQGAGDDSARQVAEGAFERVPVGDGEYSAINADYMIHTLLDACDRFDELETEEGSAFGHFSWGGGTVPLTGRGLAPGAPAAVASGPVQSSSLTDALAMAQAMGMTNVPNAGDLQANMPGGLSLERLPAPMSGQAGGGGEIAPNAPEWFVSYSVELVDQGEHIAAQWFDPRR